jgi:PAS domain S-box-containing protein
MNDDDKSKQQLIEELAELRRRVAALESIDAERRRAEEELRESEERYRFLAETVPHPMWRCHANGEVIEFNGRWYEYTGQTPEEAKGNGWMRALHPDDLERVAERSQQAVASGGVYEVEYRLRKRDGSYRWHLARSLPMKDRTGRIIYRFGSATDIDDQKRAQEELAKSQTILQATIDCLPFNFFAIGLDGRYTLQNAVSKAQQRADVIGKLPEEVCPNEHDLAIWLDNNRRAFAGEKVEGEVSLSLGGEERFYYNVIAPISDGTEFYGILGVNIDITERKRAEEALQKAHDELEQRVEERTADLAKANEQLKQEVEERRRAEESLRQSERRFRNYFEQGLIGMAVTSLDKRWLEVNDRLCEIVGYSREELHQKSWIELTHPGDLEPNLQLFNRLLAGDIEHFTFDKRYIKKDGGIVHATIHTRAFHKEDGTIDHIVLLVEDITARKQAEESLRQSERRFRNYFEQGLIGMAVTSLDKRWLEVNDRLCEILGYRREELVQTNWAALTHPDDVEPNLRLFNPLVAGEIDHFTLNKRYLKKDGSIVHATIHTRAFRKDDGTVDHIVTLIEDITARKQAEEALRISEEKYRTLVETSPDAVMMLDLGEHITLASQRAVELYGAERVEELLGRNPLEFFVPEDQQRFLTNLRRTVDEGVTRDVEYTFVRKDGTRLAGEASAAAIRDVSGRPTGCVAIVRDMTERRQAQEALERERQSLWRMLQASDHERQTISYEIHDGLAQYLAAATMQFQAHDSLGKNSPKEAKKAYETATELVRQAHSESRRLISEVRPPVIDEDGIETAISHLVHEQRRRGGPKIECHSDVQFGRLPAVLENALYRIVQEALTNACKHSKSKKVTVSMTQEGQDVRLEVRDWGIGFDPESVGEGHFGLEGIRQRVRLLGGRLTIETTPGSGTLVQVVVPILEKHE